MNILQNISAKELLIRTFIVPDANSVLSDFDAVSIHRIYQTDPEFVQFSPFVSGYMITLTLSTCADLRYIADQHLLAELVVARGDGNPVQIGSEEGFQLIGIIPPPALNSDLYTYTFRTLKPNNQPFKTRIYV